MSAQGVCFNGFPGRKFAVRHLFQGGCVKNIINAVHGVKNYIPVPNVAENKTQFVVIVLMAHIELLFLIAAENDNFFGIILKKSVNNCIAERTGSTRHHIRFVLKLVFVIHIIPFIITICSFFSTFCFFRKFSHPPKTYTIIPVKSEISFPLFHPEILNAKNSGKRNKGTSGKKEETYNRNFFSRRRPYLPLKCFRPLLKRNCYAFGSTSSNLFYYHQ